MSTLSLGPKSWSFYKNSLDGFWIKTTIVAKPKIEETAKSVTKQNWIQQSFTMPIWAKLLWSVRLVQPWWSSGWNPTLCSSTPKNLQLVNLQPWFLTRRSRLAAFLEVLVFLCHERPSRILAVVFDQTKNRIKRDKTETLKNAPRWLWDTVGYVSRCWYLKHPRATAGASICFSTFKLGSNILSSSWRGVQCSQISKFSGTWSTHRFVSLTRLTSGLATTVPNCCWVTHYFFEIC